jgi:arginine:ornithine antiporter/lysine permease
VIRELCGLQLRLRILGEQRRRKRVLPGVHYDHTGNLLSGVGRRQHIPRCRAGLGLRVVLPLLDRQGICQAAAVNRIVTIAKLVPIVVFIIVVGFAFDPQTFAANFWGGETRSVRSLFDQVTDTMLVTTFVFLGVEGASVYSRFARRREDVGRATLLGFLSVLAIFASVTMVSYGVLPRAALANTHPPSMAAVLESVVGPLGATFISIGVIISVQGAYLAWTLINAEVLYTPATTAVMPKFLARNNKNHTPIAALITTNVAVQALLLSMLVVRDALDFMLALDTALSLVPYLFAAGYASSSPSPATCAE